VLNFTFISIDTNGGDHSSFDFHKSRKCFHVLSNNQLFKKIPGDIQLVTVSCLLPVCSVLSGISATEVSQNLSIKVLLFQEISLLLHIDSTVVYMYFALL